MLHRTEYFEYEWITGEFTPEDIKGATVNIYAPSKDNYYKGWASINIPRDQNPVFYEWYKEFFQTEYVRGLVIEQKKIVVQSNTPTKLIKKRIAEAIEYLNQYVDNESVIQVVLSRVCAQLNSRVADRNEYTKNRIATELPQRLEYVEPDPEMVRIEDEIKPLQQQLRELKAKIHEKEQELKARDIELTTQFFESDTTAPDRSIIDAILENLPRSMNEKYRKSLRVF